MYEFLFLCRYLKHSDEGLHLMVFGGDGHDCVYVIMIDWWAVVLVVEYNDGGGVIILLGGHSCLVDCFCGNIVVYGVC